MQKFTVFSILLSVSVILMIGDIIAHDYLGGSNELVEEVESTEEIEPSVETENTDEPTEESTEESVDLSEDTSEVILEPTLSLDILENSGFYSPVLKDISYSGLLFQFITFSDQTEAFIYQWNFFDGEQYIGSIYEIRYPTETGSFQGYLALRERASGLSELGTVNEVNNYGDASFYFNHKTKVKTIHLVLRRGSTIYAFEYAQNHHEKMKKVFDILGSTL